MVQNVMKNDEYPPKIKAGGYILIGQGMQYHTIG